MKAVNPHIIYASITGYGDQGPLKDMPGYDVMASSFGGLIGVTGSENEPVCTHEYAFISAFTLIL